ncbi:MAG: hypothetical protein V4643_04750 [Bacteroidota bacterium]
MKIKGLIFLIIFFIGVKSLLAQTKDLTSQKVVHQVEYGLNYMNYYNNYRQDFNGWGYMAYFNGITLSSTHSINYKCIINNKHIIKLGYTRFYSNTERNNYPDLGKNEFSLSYVSLGYGRKLPFSFKKIVPSVFAMLNYRYRGGEAADYAWRDMGFEKNFTVLKYDQTVGIALGIELEYFFIQNLGLGINTYVNYFPFENARFKGDGVDSPSQEFIDSHKPNNFFINTTFKLAYRFSLPSFKKK